MPSSNPGHISRISTSTTDTTTTSTSNPSDPSSPSIPSNNSTDSPQTSITSSPVFPLSQAPTFKDPSGAATDTHTPPRIPALTDTESHRQLSIALAAAYEREGSAVGSHSGSTSSPGPQILTCGTRANPEPSRVLSLFSPSPSSLSPTSATQPNYLQEQASSSSSLFIPGKGPLVLTAELHVAAVVPAATKSQPHTQLGSKKPNVDKDSDLVAALDSPGGKLAELAQTRREVREGWEERVRVAGAGALETERGSAPGKNGEEDEQDQEEWEDGQGLRWRLGLDGGTWVRLN